MLRKLHSVVWFRGLGVDNFNYLPQFIDKYLLSLKTIGGRGGFLSKMWSDFRWPLGRFPTVWGGATMAIPEPPMQQFF